MSERALRLLLTWERADGISTPELAATWCELAIEVGEDAVTLIKDRRSDSIRQSVRTSAYPLALWVAQHWWTLTEHVRASATDIRALRWTSRLRPAWLSYHNLRGAGDGMPWPDLAILPEGGIARLVWFRGAGLADQPVTFLTSGHEFVPMGDVRAGLTDFVESVLTRLDARGLHRTALHQEWQGLADLATEERDFARACGRLGLDPFSVPEPLADEIAQLEHLLPDELLEDFLAAADAENLQQAVRWVETARGRLHAAKPVVIDIGSAPIDEQRPWLTGYTVAREARRKLGLDATDFLEVDDLVGLHQLDDRAGGMRGLAGRVDDGIGLVMPSRHGGRSGARFSQAWAGLTTLSERAFELIADRYGASPTLVAHQYEDQILESPR